MRRLTILAAILATPLLCSAEVILDQIGSFPQSVQAAVRSQLHEPAEVANDCQAIDNFTIATPARLTSVELLQLGFGSTGFWRDLAVGYWRVDVHSTPASAGTSLVGDVGSILVPSATSVQHYGNYDLVLLDVTAANLTLPSGEWWIGVSAQYDSALGYAGTATSTIGDGTSYLANPGGGLALGSLHDTSPWNLAYRVNAVPVPEPSLLAAIGLAPLMLCRRRNSPIQADK